MGERAEEAALETQQVAGDALGRAHVMEIDANHYTITTHDDSIAAIGAFLHKLTPPGQAGRCGARRG